MTVLCVIAFSLGATPAFPREVQITSTPKNHNLDNNDNFSADGRFLCYDTREGVGPGIGNCQSIEMVAVDTGAETVLYAPRETVISPDEKRSAPGVGAVTFCPTANKVAFIHGPLLEEVAARGYYGKPNRRGAEVAADGSGALTWLDCRDPATDRDTLPGAHRGGTHRHEYSLDGRRIGFTYDDVLLPQYGRTIGYMEAHPVAPGDATHYFAVLVPVVPAGTAKPGEIETALGDSWVGRDGRVRAFIGKVREADGVSYTESLFTVTLSPQVDITTADSGGPARYPAPPKGVSVRRLTHTWASGVVRGSYRGDRIAYYAKDAADRTQVFIIPVDGSDRDPDPAKRPVQVTNLPQGAATGLRWHPTDNTVFCIGNNAIAAVCVAPGPRFGETVFLTPQDGVPRTNLVVSPDGKRLAYNKPVSARAADGSRLVNYKGEDFLQIFMIDFPDADGDGVADAR